MSDFIRILHFEPPGEKPDDERVPTHEIIINTAMISKIHIKYAKTNKDGEPCWETSIPDGLENPDARRWFFVYVGNERFQFPPDPDSPAYKLLEDIYMKALR